MTGQSVRHHGDFVTPPAARSRAHLSLSHGGLLTRRITPMEQLKRAVQEAAARCKRVDVANSSAYPCPLVAEIASGVRFPVNALAKLLALVLIGGGSVEFGRALCRALWHYNDAMAEAIGRPVPPSDLCASVVRELPQVAA